jgi:subtilisin-like proprotein convertase family protein
MRKLYLSASFFVLGLFALNAQSPADLNADVTVTTNWTSVANIETTFNTARRQEETQLGLGVNAIMNLDLPSQAIWDGYSIDQRALYLMNDERTARAGINYGAGAVKGWPFNGIEANIDAVAQAWAQYNVDNNVFEHCHPTMATMDCSEGRIAGAYPGGCTEFGGGIENLHASSSGTISMAEVTLDAIFGWIYEDAGSAWGHRQAMLAQDYDDDYGEAMQEGFVGFGIAQTTDAATQWKTVVVANFTNPVADAQAGACGYNVTVTTNSLAGPPCATPPTINSVAAVQPPDCNTPVGSITVNATGNGTLQYSVDAGANWQLGNVFNNLVPGNYTVSVRLQAMQNCVTNYNQNPVVINAPMGCGGNCTDYPLTGLNLNIPDNTPAGVTSTINVPTAGTITDINVKGLNGNHTYVGALTFSLQSPMGTTITLISSNNNCNASSFNISLDDQAGNPLTCLDNAGNTVQPQNPLSGFNGQNAQGNWVLTVADGDAFNDIGTLNGWTLEVCVQGTPCTPPTINTVAVTQPTCATPTGSIVVNATGTGTLEYSVNNGTTYQASNNFGNLAPGNYNILVRIQGSNPVCSSAYTQNPVVLNTPTGCGGNCMDYVATDLPLDIIDNMTATSTINIATAGTITDVNVKNLAGTHTFVGDLTFTLMSPQGTSVTLIANRCGDVENFSITLDDEAAGALNCPINDMATERPQNALSAFDGQNPMGNWLLMVNDNANGDEGQLTGWALEICVSGGNPCPTNLPVNNNPIAGGTYQAGTQLTSSGSIGAGNNVTFRAGNNIELQPNFNVLPTAVFEAKIEGCQ